MAKAKNESKYVAAVFDSFAYICPHFTSQTDENGGYGCYHPNLLKEDVGTDYAGNPCGSCLLGGCPLGYSADDDDLKNPAIDWQGSTPEPGDVENEYIIVAIGSNASEEEKAAAEKYVRYINRYLPKEESTC